MSVFDAARRIGAREAAQRAGIHLKAKGQRAWACCPIHGEKTASLCFYPQGSWYCFGCHRGGDAVALYAALYGLAPKAAARQLLADFGLSGQGGRESAGQVRAARAKRAAQAQRRADEARALDLLCWAERTLRDPQPPPATWEEIAPWHMALLKVRDQITGILDMGEIPDWGWKVVVAVAGARDQLAQA